MVSKAYHAKKMRRGPDEEAPANLKSTVSMSRRNPNEREAPEF